MKKMLNFPDMSEISGYLRSLKFVKENVIILFKNNDPIYEIPWQVYVQNLYEDRSEVPDFLVDRQQ